MTAGQARTDRWQVLGAALISVIASAVMLEPFMDLSHLGSALHVGDGRVQAWVLAWVAHALTSQVPVFEANMFYPSPASLAHTDHMVALAVLGTPLWLATGNAVLVFNVLQVLGPACTCFTGFLLLRAWTGDWTASMVGGVLFGLSFFALLHNAHLNLTWAAGFPLSMMLLERWWQRPTWGNLAALLATGLFTALTSWYLAVMLAIVLVTHAVVIARVAGRIDFHVRGPQMIAGGALGIAVLLPFLWPYLGRGSEAGEAIALAADVRSYVVPPEHTVIGRWLVEHKLALPQGIWGERTLFLGWTTIVLASVGLMTALRSTSSERRARAFVLLALTMLGVGLSFGPSSSGVAPFDLFALLPGVSGFRATARFALLVGLGCAGFAAFGLTWLRSRIPRAATPVGLLLAVVIMGERFVVDFPAGRPRPEPMPEVYALARADGAHAAIALPIYAGQPGWFFEGDYLLYSTSADFLPLANGIGRWVPPEYLALGEAMRTFPSPASAAALRLFGITHALLHSRRFADGAHVIAQVRESADYVVVAERGSDFVLRIKPERGPTSATK